MAADISKEIATRRKIRLIFGIFESELGGIGEKKKKKKREREVRTKKRKEKGARWKEGETRKEGSN